MNFLHGKNVVVKKPQQLVRGLAIVLGVAILTACQLPVVQQTAPAPPAAAEGNTANVAIETITPLALNQALPPALFQLPELDIEFRVVPMGWTIVEKDGARTTQWVVPPDAAGWHVNSAGAGAAGNTILSGHQAVGEAVFAPLALGEIQVGQQILLTAEDGTVYAYQVTEVSQPVPIVGATESDKQQAAAYTAPSDEPKLTLITGWPDFSTTHRIFAVAELLGRVKTQ